MPSTAPALDPALSADAEVLWQYLRVDDDLTATSVGIALGSHDLGPAVCAVELFKAGLFPLIVFSGANSPTTIDRFPRGEAIHYREEALSRGVADGAIMIETSSTSTAENITNTRHLLADHGVSVQSATLICKPYQQRYANGVIRKLWPEIDVQCTAQTVDMQAYMDQIKDPHRVINMMVGDLQRVAAVADFGLAVPQIIPAEVLAAYWRLVEAGYRSRLIPNGSLAPASRPEH